MFNSASVIALLNIYRQNREIGIRRRQLRDDNNFMDLSEKQFVLYFRVTKEMFIFIYQDLAPHFQEQYRGTAIPVKLKIATFLRFLGSGSYQNCVGNDLLTCMSQSEVSLTIKECLNIFQNHFCPKWIRLTKTVDEEASTKQHFYEKFGFPGIIGIVDGTHVRIKSPKEEERHLYYNRKGFYSLNVLLICDQNMSINFVDARHPGANHDSFIWKTSAADEYLRNSFNGGKVNTWLIGDSGYPLLPYLMTPYRYVSSLQEERYNALLCKARNIIERCNGVLKSRFRCIIGDRGDILKFWTMNSLLYTPQKATQIVNVCCGIHNACIYYKSDWTFPIEVSNNNDRIITDVEAETNNDASAEIRNRITRSML